MLLLKVLVIYLFNHTTWRPITMAYLEVETGDETGFGTLGTHEGRGKSAGPLALGV
jgi:hypothetical protein